MSDDARGYLEAKEEEEGRAVDEVTAAAAFLSVCFSMSARRLAMSSPTCFSATLQPCIAAAPDRDDDDDEEEEEAAAAAAAAAAVVRLSTRKVGREETP